MGWGVAADADWGNAPGMCPRFAPEEVVIRRAVAADAVATHELQQLAYRSEAELYGDWSISPLVEPLESTVKAVAEQNVLKATHGGRIVGSVRGRQVGEDCFVGRLIVHPELQGRGIGSCLMAALEDAMPRARRFELFTGERSERNIGLYKKLGYAELRRAPLTDKVVLVYLEKVRTGG